MAVKRQPEEKTLSSKEIVRRLRVSQTGLMGLARQCGVEPVERGGPGRGKVYLFTHEQYLAIKARRLDRLNRMCRLAQEIEREP